MRIAEWNSSPRKDAPLVLLLVLDEEANRVLGVTRRVQASYR